MLIRFFLLSLAVLLTSGVGLSQNADQTIYDYRVKYAPEHNVRLFYREGKLMLKVTVASTDIQQKNVLIRKVVEGETVEPVPDTLRGKAVDFMGEEVFVDDSVAVRVAEMIKSLRLNKIKENYDRVYKKDEPRDLGGSSWQLAFLNPKGDMQRSGGRFLVNKRKTQSELDKYLEKIRTICSYLQSVDVKFCPPKQ